MRFSAGKLADVSAGRIFPAARVFHDRFRLAVNVEFLIDPLDVGADGAEADAETTCYLLVGLATGQAVEHLELTRGERARLVQGGGAFFK